MSVQIVDWNRSQTFSGNTLFHFAVGYLSKKIDEIGSKNLKECILENILNLINNTVEVSVP